MKRETFNEAVVLFFAQIILCTVIAINYRSISQAHYIYTALSSMGIAGITYFLIQRISDNHKKRKKSKERDFAWIGFMLGSVVGDIIGIFISKLLLGS
jgi:uncharacterized protein YqgC (DUF456 family)